MELTIVQTIWLAIVQGITEFLPISSSGHLALMPAIFSFDDPGLAFSAALHWGTLLAVVVYFRADLWAMVRSLSGGTTAEDLRNRWLIVVLVVATVPAVIIGFMCQDVVAGVLRNPIIIGLLLVIGSVFLYLADRYSSVRRDIAQITLRDAVLIGLAQAVAIVPGVSRSGMTMATGRALGLTRIAATRFSFLMAIPVIIGASVLELPDVLAQGFGMMMLIGVAVVFAVAYATIALFLTFLARISFVIFMWYSIAIMGIIIFLSL